MIRQRIAAVFLMILGLAGVFFFALVVTPWALKYAFKSLGPKLLAGYPPPLQLLKDEAAEMFEVWWFWILGLALPVLSFWLANRLWRRPGRTK